MFKVPFDWCTTVRPQSFKYLSCTWETQKFRSENQMVRAIPFGKLQKIWAVIWGEQFLVCLGADHLTFEGGMGDFRKKYAAYCFWEKKNLARNFLGGGGDILHWKKISLVAYNAVKKSYTVKCRGGGGGNYISRGLGKKILTQAKPAIRLPPPHSLKSQLVDPLVDLDMFCSGLYSHRVKFYSFMFMLKIFTRVVWPLVSSKTVCNTIGPQTPQANVSNRKLHVMFI